jgi:hypothetical protein
MPNVYSDTLSHDAVMVWLAPPSRDIVGGVQMRTAPPPTVGDDVPVGELATVRVGLVFAVTDDTPAAEAVTARLVLPVMVVDILAPDEAATARLGVLLPAVGDDLLPTDVVVLALRLPGVSVTDDAAVADSVEIRAALVGVDTLVPTDAATVQMPVPAAGVDVVGPTDAVALALNVLTLAVSDAPAAVDVAGILTPIVIQVGDTMVVDERRNASMLAPKKIKIHGKP